MFPFPVFAGLFGPEVVASPLVTADGCTIAPFSCNCAAIVHSVYPPSAPSKANTAVNTASETDGCFTPQASYASLSDSFKTSKNHHLGERLVRIRSSEVACGTAPNTCHRLQPADHDVTRVQSFPAKGIKAIVNSPYAGTSTSSATVVGSGMAHPNSRIHSRCPSIASFMRSRVASSVTAAPTHPGRSGT